MSEEKKELKVVSGDSSNLSFSPVYEHLPSEKPKTHEQMPKHIVVPKGTAEKKKDKRNKK